MLLSVVLYPASYNSFRRCWYCIRNFFYREFLFLSGISWTVHGVNRTVFLGAFTDALIRDILRCPSVMLSHVVRMERGLRPALTQAQLPLTQGRENAGCL